MLDLVSQMRATILHLRDARIRILRVRPVVVGALLLSFAVKARKLFTAGIFDSRSSGQFLQILVILLARVSPDDRFQGGVGFQRRRIHRDRLTVHQPMLDHNLQHPAEHRLMRLNPDQPPRPRHRRVIRCHLIQRVTEKTPQ